ncbi:8077_t:CDS:2 [Racocetra fulgida]|uniref:8077_t:CDS:1 n=1 Tax=Racocetra fulgida TaxID=60492 RepID=A0A9N8WQC8_9GLOM|nr:8077_t:CDS:2 [Racocetra fulgida]
MFDKFLPIRKEKEEKETIFKFKFENEDAFTLKFKSSIKLQDVREKLALHKDYPGAESLQFVDKDRTLITYECEDDYNLGKLSDENSIIHVKFLFMSINVNIDGLERTHYLNPKHNFTKVRRTMKTFIENEFLFRKQNGRIIETDEEESNNLEKFLKNDTLYISILKESDVSIRIYHDMSHHHSFNRLLDKKMDLSEIRSILSNNPVIDPERMKSNYRFSDQNMDLISKPDEIRKKLYEILHINEYGSNVLNIRKIDNPDWAKLNNKCGYGFIIDKDSLFVKQIQSPKYRAFTIKATAQPYFDYDYIESLFECKSEFDELCSKNFITFGKVSFILPFISISFGLDQKRSRDKLKSNKKGTKYEYIKIRHATIDLDKSNIVLTDGFNNEIEAALKENTRNEHKHAEEINNQASFSNNIQELFNNEINLGESSNTTNNIKSSKGKFSSTREIKGGNKNESQPDYWINSLNDSDTWDIIEHNKVYSIFDLLKGDLRNEVIKVLGKRILKDGIDKISYPTFKKEPYGHHIGQKLDDISNIKDCEIFSTIMKERNRHIFSSCVAYDAPDAPVIVIQRVPSKKSPKRELENLKSDGLL